MIKDNFRLGLITGILLPIISFGLFYGLNYMMVENHVIGNDVYVWPGFKDSTIALTAICVNLLPSIPANRRYYDHYIRGISLPTVIGAFIWLFYFDALELFK